MPPDPKLQLYLAQRYYSGPKADIIAAKYGDGRKKKKKKTSDSTALTIHDDSEAWPSEQAEDDEQGDIVQVPTTVESGWSAVGTHASGPPAPTAPAPPTLTPAPAATAPVPRAGLMTREEIRAQREARRAAEQAQREQEQEEEPEQETVYRDEQGRRVDVAEEEARIRAEKEAEAAKEKERATWTQGLAQRRESEARRAGLHELRKEGVTRYAITNKRRK